MLQLVFCIGLCFTFPLLAFDTPIKLDGKEYSVYFNDGDTFQIHSSQISQAAQNHKISARLKGFNALEAYGPVHQWGTWTAEELYENSKEATAEARKGGWHCQTVGARDKYGRILVDCPDLSKALISKGLAHVMFVNSADYDSELVQVQQQAIHNQVGMWKKSIPNYILTSIHSAAEKDLSGKAYDRFVSTRDGHSLVRNHTNAYHTCEKVAYTPEEKETASTMVYVPFETRYGPHKAICLKR